MQPPGWPLSLTVRGTLFTWIANPFYTYGIYTGDSSTSVLIADYGQDAIDNAMVPDGSDTSKWYLNVNFAFGNVDAFVSDQPTNLFTLLGAWSPDPNVFVPNTTVYGFGFFSLARGLFNTPLGPTDLGINSCFKQCYLAQGVSLDGIVFPYCLPR